MFLVQHQNRFFPQPYNVNSTSGANNSNVLGTTQKWTIDRTWPIEEIIVCVNFTVNTGGLTLVSSPATPDQFDNVLTMLQHVNLSINDGTKPRSAVDCSGIGLLEYCYRKGMNLDQGTLNLMALSQSGNLPAGNYKIVYRIPMVDPGIGEPVRSRMYLPVHRHPQDPVLTLTFQSAANIYSSGNINYVGVEVILKRREPTQASEAAIAAVPTTNPWGYIDFDLIETPYAVPVGSGAQVRIALPIPGSYTDLLFRHYLGGSTVSRAEIDSGAAGTSFGNEGQWFLQSGNVNVRDWAWQDLRIEAEMNDVMPALILPGVYVAATSAGSPTTLLSTKPPFYGQAGGTFPTTQGYRAATTCFFDFLSDGLSSDMAKELGSVLDCNFPSTSGLKMEVVGTPTSVSTNASYLYLMGRRLFGDLSAWQKFN
jgi:hypothetical protein